MSGTSAAARAISLYRQILRAAIHWADAQVKASAASAMQSRRPSHPQKIFNDMSAVMMRSCATFSMQEQKYIRSEAAKHFRANRGAAGAEREAALREGETRLHYAQHCESR